MSAPDLVAVTDIITRLGELGVPQKALEPVRDWLRDRRDGKPETVVFFGTWQDVGHYWWESDASGRPRRPDRRSSLEPIGPWEQVDGKLTPRDTTKQSATAIHHKNGWTALAMHDYTVDSRGGSNAVFLMDADVSFERALIYAMEAFPSVIERINRASPITLVQTEDRR